MLKQFSQDIESAAERIASVLSGDSPKHPQASRGKLPYGHPIIGMATPEEIAEKARIAAEKKASEQRRRRTRQLRSQVQIEKACPCGNMMHLTSWNASKKYCSIECRKKYVHGVKPEKHICTPEIDAAITKAYRESVGMHHLPVTKSIAEKYGIPDWKIRKRAYTLGVVPCTMKRGKPRDWSEEEIRIIRDNAAFHFRVIQTKLKDAGFIRSIGAIHTKYVRAIGQRPTGNYTARYLSRVFGIDVHSIILWIRKGFLKANRKPGACRDDLYDIRPEDVRQFIIDHVEVVDLRKVDKFWLVDLLTGKE